MKYLFIITGRRWFQKTYGNTYHTVTMEVRNENGDTVYTYKSGQRYGYGNQFIATAVEYLMDAGYLDGIKIYNSGSRESLWRYCDRVGYPEPIINVLDVAREKDL